MDVLDDVVVLELSTGIAGPCAGKRWVRTPAPRLSAHNDEILRGYLRLSDAEIERLRTDGVIGTEPLGSNPSFDL